MARAISSGELETKAYASLKGRTRAAPVAAAGSGAVISTYFDISYGQRQLHNKDGLSPGKSLVISASGMDNGCYGFFDFEDLIQPPFVTVPSTGSIGKAHVQKWPCGVTDDCLLLVPKQGVTMEYLYIAAAVIRAERWRFNYGRKITPDRIASYPMPVSAGVVSRVKDHIEAGLRLEEAAIEIAEDEFDLEIGRSRIAQLAKGDLRLIQGTELSKRLSRCES
jgi:hypothetical protein